MNAPPPPPSATGHATAPQAPRGLYLVTPDEPDTARLLLCDLVNATLVRAVVKRA